MKVLLTVLFVVAAPFTLFLASILLLTVVHNNADGKNHLIASHPQPVSYAALPSLSNTFSHEITHGGTKEEALRQFFARYDSVLYAYADKIVETAEKYDLDYRLIPAIAMQETNLCAKINEGSHNCWGYGVTANNYKYFDSYEQGIETVSWTLAKHYRDKYDLVTPDEIMKMYTPASTGSWAASVNHFMAEIAS